MFHVKLSDPRSVGGVENEGRRMAGLATRIDTDTTPPLKFNAMHKLNKLMHDTMTL